MIFGFFFVCSVSLQVTRPIQWQKLIVAIRKFCGEGESFYSVILWLVKFKSIVKISAV